MKPEGQAIVSTKKSQANEDKGKKNEERRKNRDRYINRTPEQVRQINEARANRTPEQKGTINM